MAKVTFSETEGKQQKYSYTVDYTLPKGSWDAREVPSEVVQELEAVVQSADCPDFMYSPSGNVLVTVS